MLSFVHTDWHLVRPRLFSVHVWLPDHRCRLCGCYGARVPMGKIMWVLNTDRILPPFCNFLYWNAWFLCSDAIISCTAAKLLSLEALFSHPLRGRGEVGIKEGRERDGKGRREEERRGREGEAAHLHKFSKVSICVWDHTEINGWYQQRSGKLNPCLPVAATDVLWWIILQYWSMMYAPN